MRNLHGLVLFYAIAVDQSSMSTAKIIDEPAFADVFQRRVTSGYRWVGQMQLATRVPADSLRAVGRNLDSGLTGDRGQWLQNQLGFFIGR